MLLPHRSKIIMQFISQLFTFTEITDYFCNPCVFNVNLCVNENLVYAHAVTDAFCPCALDVCTQKTIYQKFKLIWFRALKLQRKFGVRLGEGPCKAEEQVKYWQHPSFS